MVGRRRRASFVAVVISVATLVVGVAMPLAAAVPQDGVQPPRPPKPPTSPAPNSAPPKTPSPAPRVESPAIELEYQSTADPKLRPVQKLVTDSELFEAVVDDLNSFLVLPTRLPVIFRDCDDANAYYDPENGEISICWQLVAQFLEDFSDEGVARETVEEQALDSTAFTFYHELGHALVDILELPITGKEEDAVDQLAAVILIEMDDDDIGEEMAFNGAEAFYLSSTDPSELTDDDFADEHSLDQQRYYDIVCLVYGSNPENFASVVEDGDLPEARAEQCPYEYEQKSMAWDRLLADHVLSDETAR